MTNSPSDTPVSSLRQRMIEDMNMRRFTRKTQTDYVRHVARFATILGALPILRQWRTYASSRSNSAMRVWAYRP